MVQISRAPTWLHWLRPRGRHVGHRLHYGWAIRRIASFPWWFRNGPAVPDLKSFGTSHKRTDGVFQQKPKIRGAQIPRDHQARDLRKAIYDKSVEESTPAHDWSSKNGPCRETDWRAGTQASLFRRYSWAWGWRRTDKFDSSSIATNLFVIVTHHELRDQIWYDIHARIAYSARNRLGQLTSKWVGKLHLHFCNQLSLYPSLMLLHSPDGLFDLQLSCLLAIYQIASQTGLKMGCLWG